MISAKPLKTFQYQDELPRLPIPQLDETGAKLWNSLSPFLKGKDLSTVGEKVFNFFAAGGLGEELQKRLLDYDKSQNNSWLEKWWLEYAYHRYREPTLINVNWYSLGKDDPSTPKPFQADSLAPFSEFQVKRAANLIHQFLLFWRSIEDQTMPPEFSGKSPVCMNQYRCMFGMTRIPLMECDQIQGAYPVSSDHITVFVKNHPYYVPVYDRILGKVYSTAEIENQLLDVIKDVANVPVSEGVCLLTAGRRDIWAQARSKLLEISPENSETLNRIQDSIFVVSLDDHLVNDDLESKKNNIFHGKDANNRWLDAAISLIVDPSGTAGMNGEHSPLDALVPILVLDSSLKFPMDANITPPYPDSRPIKRLKFKSNQEIGNYINEAKDAIKKTIADSDSFVLVYSTYGTTFIKKTAKTSPDAYIQMAIQLAYYSMYGKCVSTYESGSTRKFKHGRTDVIRTLSNESLAFCEAMADNSKDASACHQALQKAAHAHVQYATGVSQGLGIDRHLLGLRLCLKPGESHPMFEDSIISKSQSWRLSTSSMFKTDDIMATGFGAVDPDGYGLNYIPSADGTRITFGIESKHNSTVSDTKKFTACLTEALDHMHRMCEDAAHLQKPSL